MKDWRTAFVNTYEMKKKTKQMHQNQLSAVLIFLIVPTTT